MERLPKCKSLVAIFKNDKMVLDGPHEIKFDIKKDVIFHICIEQLGIRKINISSDKDVSAFELYAILTRVERLLMLLEGSFITLSEINLSDSDTVDDTILHSCKNHLLKLLIFVIIVWINYSILKILLQKICFIDGKNCLMN